LQRNATQSAWRCQHGHNFDIASQGYTHLLPVQNKRSRDPGDSKEMVSARRCFLNAGHYEPIALAVSEAICTNPPKGKPLRCLDAGCGEGYYLRQLSHSAGEPLKLEILGLDISKWAIMAAAKQDKHSNWVIGSNANLPVQSGQIDRLLCMFGFPVYSEFARVLSDDGLLVMVDAGPQHLRELREIIYPIIKPEKPATQVTPDGFRQLSSKQLQYSIHLDSSEQVSDLLAMTPHLFRATPEGRERAFALKELGLSIDVKVSILQKNQVAKTLQVFNSLDS
jgi:23S rRNA (guanine745-N1)-methyltransferase